MIDSIATSFSKSKKESIKYKGLELDLCINDSVTRCLMVALLLKIIKNLMRLNYHTLSQHYFVLM